MTVKRRAMGALIALLLMGLGRGARAEDAPPAAAATTSSPAPQPPPRTPYDAFLDIGFKALYEGELGVAEEAFRQAAALPGDAVRSSLATSFAERAARLRTSPDGAREGQARAPVTARPGSETPRTVFLATTALLGLGLYGWSLPATLGLTADDDRAGFVGLYLVTAGAAIFVPAALVDAASMTPAQANLAYYGGTRGIWHGALLGATLFGNIGPDRRYQLWSGSLLVGSVAELAGGSFLARKRDLDAGEARTIEVAADFGLGGGLALGAILGLHHDDRSEDSQARGMAIVGLLGTAAGLGGGFALAARRDHTWGDGEVWRATGLLGAGLGLAANALFEWRPDQSDQKKFFLTLMGSSAAGLWLGDRLVRNTDFTVSESVLIDLASLGGALGGTGIAYLLTSESLEFAGKALLGGAALGGGLGFGLAYVSLHTGARSRAILQDTIASRGSTIAVFPLIGQKGEQGLSLAGTF